MNFHEILFTPALKTEFDHTVSTRLCALGNSSTRLVSVVSYTCGFREVILVLCAALTLFPDVLLKLLLWPVSVFPLFSALLASYELSSL